MIVCEGVSQLRETVRALRAAGRSIGFVPTMGALHAGHVSLMHSARADGHAVIVSIFVNPTQFGPSEDFDRYPRPLEADSRICRESGVDLLFTPSATEVYPPGDETRVRVAALAETMCGRSRPGHFEGVCTVVAKLFGLVQPDAAYFGQKDAQQAIILRRMTLDLCMPIRIRVCPIVREADGLALSSRNQYLSQEERNRALALPRALGMGRDLVAGGERSAGRIVSAMAGVLRDGGVNDIEYLVAVNPESLQEQSEIARPVLLAAAVRVGRTRLIDNLLEE